ncbi:MAG: hypothetical protein U0798_04810 [Gemmataceae bacterium]
MTASLLVFLSLSSAPAAEPVSHRFIASDRERGKMLIIGADGKTEWEFANRHDVHAIQVLPNGNFLTQTSNTTTVEVNPKKEIVWKYESKPKEGTRAG